MALWGELLRRVWYLGRRSQFDRELDEELPLITCEIQGRKAQCHE